MIQQKQKESRVVGYVRVSRDEVEQTFERSVQIQKENISEYAKKHGYQEINCYYVDLGSGDDKFLEALQDLLNDARLGLFDLVICRDIDRFARDLLKQLLIEEDLKKFGVHVEYTSQNFEDNEYGRLCRNILASVSQFQKESIVSRMNRAKRFMVKQGHVMLANREYYGYDKYLDEQNIRRLKPNRLKVFVKLIVQMYLDGAGTRDIARALDSHKVESPGETSEWTQQKVYRILSRVDAYAGKWMYGKINSKGKENPRKDWIAVEIPAIISKDDAERVKQRLKSRRRRDYPNLKVDW